MPESICSVEDCDEPQRSRGWCNTHYARWWRTTEAGQNHQRRRNERRRKQRRANPAIQRAEKFRYRYGITPADYQALLVAQDGVCAVCGRAGHTVHPLHVDHDHATGAVRGLLCAPCNQAIGSAGDDPRVLRSLADYLEVWRP